MIKKKLKHLSKVIKKNFCSNLLVKIIYRIISNFYKLQKVCNKKMIKMNKFKIGCLIIIIIGICIFNYVNPSKYLTSRKSSPDFEYLGNEKYVNDSTSFKFSGFNGTWSLIRFDSIKDNKITINNNSKINEEESYVVI